MSVMRRAAVVAAFATLTLVLVEDIRHEVPAVERVLSDIGGPAMDRVPFPPEFTLALAVVALSGAAATVAMLSGARGAGLLALITASTLTWLTFPFAQLTWLRLFVAAPVGTVTPSPTVWLATAGLVVLACLEAVAATQEALLADLKARGVPAEDVASVRVRAAWSSAATFGGALALALPAALAAAGGLGSTALRVHADLVLVPAAIGLAIGAYLWYASRAAPA